MNRQRRKEWPFLILQLNLRKGERNVENGFWGKSWAGWIEFWGRIRGF